MAIDPQLDEITTRLAAIQDELLLLPAGASAEKYALLQERDALRELSATFRWDADESRTTDELVAELASLRLRRDHEIRGRIGYVSSKGGSNQGPASGAWVRLAAQAREGANLDRINARIAHIEDLLATRKRNSESD